MVWLHWSSEPEVGKYSMECLGRTGCHCSPAGGESDGVSFASATGHQTLGRFFLMSGHSQSRSSRAIQDSTHVPTHHLASKWLEGTVAPNSSRNTWGIRMLPTPCCSVTRHQLATSQAAFFMHCWQETSLANIPWLQITGLLAKSVS